MSARDGVDPAQAPRCCIVRQHDSGRRWVWKTAWASREEIPARVLNTPTEPYLCEFCGSWHVGSVRSK